MARKSGLAAAWICGCILLCGSQALAQVQPNGMPFGGFRLYPSLDVSANYDDNVYRTDTATMDDWFIKETPGLKLQSDWLRHQLDVYASLSALQYTSLTHESHVDWNLGGDGRLDILQGLDFSVTGQYTALHESRTSPDQPGLAKSPTEFEMGQAHAALEYHPYHFGFTLGGNYTRFDYSPTKLIGLPDLDNHDRDRDEFVGYVKGAYEFSPGYAVYVQGNLRDVGYDLTLDRSGLNRSNHGYSIDVGLDMLVTEVINGQVFAGYMAERYHAGLPDVTGLGYGANLTWTPTAFWAVHLTASRTPNATTLDGASAEDDQLARLGVDYLITPTLTVLSHVQYLDSDYHGSLRDDTYTEAGIGLNYAMNEYLNVKVEYDYQTRSSSLADQGFTDNALLAGVNLHI